MNKFVCKVCPEISGTQEEPCTLTYDGDVAPICCPLNVDPDPKWEQIGCGECWRWERAWNFCASCGAKLRQI